MSSNKVEIVKKISPSKIFGKIDIVKLFANGETEASIYTIFGYAYGVERGETEFGPWAALMGDFAVICKGVEYRSPKLFAPSIVNDIVLPKLEGNAKLSRIDFAFEVFVKRDTTAATGYTYGIRPILAPNEDDPLERLRSQVVAALPAPTPEKDKKK